MGGVLVGKKIEKKIRGFYYDFMPLGQAFKMARESENITRERLAEEAGYGARHIQGIENEGHFPSVEFLVWLAQKFNISIDQYIFPQKNIKQTSTRRQVDSLLDKLTDQEISIIYATAKAIIRIREPED